MISDPPKPKVKSSSLSFSQSDPIDITHSTLITQSLKCESSAKINPHLVLSTFKTTECPNKLQHNFKTCPFYHNKKDRRREIMGSLEGRSRGCSEREKSKEEEITKIKDKQEINKFEESDRREEKDHSTIEVIENRGEKNQDAPSLSLPPGLAALKPPPFLLPIPPPISPSLPSIPSPLLPRSSSSSSFYYSPELCEFAEKECAELCPFGDKCEKSHNFIEQLYHPSKYKKRFCSFYPYNVGLCEYGKFCSFSHSEMEIGIELIHNLEFDEDFWVFWYKTVWCPFNLSHHDKVLCVYAHNWQDFRRKPHIVEYSPIPCPDWKTNKIILNYSDGGCHFGENCRKSHGWKEAEFHPLNYKAKPCIGSIAATEGGDGVGVAYGNKGCPRGSVCPYYHNEKERRILSSNLLNSCFRFWPRNRIVSNTFKVRTRTTSEKTGRNRGYATVKATEGEDLKGKERIRRDQVRKYRGGGWGMQGGGIREDVNLIMEEYFKNMELKGGRRTVDEKPNKRISFLDEEMLRRASDSVVVDKYYERIFHGFSPACQNNNNSYTNKHSISFEKKENPYDLNDFSDLAEEINRYLPLGENEEAKQA